MEPSIPPLVTSNRPKDHNRRETIVLVILLILLLIGVGFGLYTVLRPEPINFQERAQVKQTLSCPANGATCSWSAVSGAASYSFVILDQTTSQNVSEGTTQSTSVSFTPIVSHTYTCTVKASNQCGTGPESKAVNSCVGIGTPTPTPQTPTPTLPEGQTPTPTPTGTPVPTPTPTLIRISTPTGTPPPTGGITPTGTPVPPVQVVVTTLPTPTGTVIAQAQPTVTSIPTFIPTFIPTPTFSPTLKPKPPVSGSNTGILFMVVSTVILVSLMLVF